MIWYMRDIYIYTHIPLCLYRSDRVDHRPAIRPLWCRTVALRQVACAARWRTGSAKRPAPVQELDQLDPMNFHGLMWGVPSMVVPSGKRLRNYGKIHPCSSWVNPLFRLGHGFNSKLLVYQRVPPLMDDSTMIFMGILRCFWWDVNKIFQGKSIKNMDDLGVGLFQEPPYEWHERLIIFSCFEWFIILIICKSWTNDWFWVRTLKMFLFFLWVWNSSIIGSIVSKTTESLKVGLIISRASLPTVT